jgi:hypothetical protein
MRPSATVDCPNCGDLLGLKDFVPNRGAICPRCGMVISFAILQQALQAAAPPAPPEEEIPEEGTEEEVAADAPPPPPAPKPPAQPEAEEDALAGEPLSVRLGRPSLGSWVAFAAGCIAVLAASITPIAFLSKFLSLAGLLLGVWLAFAQAKAGKVHWPLAAAVLCLLTLLSAGNWPRFRYTPPPRPAVEVIPHDPTGMAPPRPLEEGEWVDAAANDVRRHDIRVQIVSAKVGPADLQRAEEPPAPTKTKHLILQLAVVCDGPRAVQLLYQPWADTKETPSKHPPVLTDSKEKRYTQDTFDPLKVAGRGEKRRSLIGTQIREVLVYPAPPTGAEYLRLELPGSAYDVDGTFRFQIPRSMIQLPPAPPGPAHGGRP